jgi:glycosyltransferase involved in cell wall biosynthesis
MRILVINYEYPPIGGGGGFVTRDIIEHMASKGHHVTVITSRYKDLPRKKMVNGVNIVRVPVFFRNKLEVANMPSMLFYVPSAIINTFFSRSTFPYDIINTHFAVPSGPVGQILSKLLGIPNVLSIHGGDIFDPSKTLSPHKTPILSNIVRFILKKADMVVAQSNDTRENAKKYYGIGKEINVISLGIKKPSFRKKKRSDFGLENDQILFTTIGRLVKRKNIEESLLILKEISNIFKFKLLIIGDGPEKNHLQEMAGRLGLYKQVLFLGNVSDEVKFQLLDISDCYLSTAIHEGFGLVFLEAMECGLPIICYNRGGQNDFLVDGETGYVVDFGDKRTFGKKVVDLVNNLELRYRISSHNRNLIKNYYISTCADKYLSLFEKVISTCKPPERSL